MKRWHIITGDAELPCEFVGISRGSLLLVLKCKGVRVKVRIHDFSDYRSAINDHEVSAIALSPKGKDFDKPIKIIFK